MRRICTIGNGQRRAAGGILCLFAATAILSACGKRAGTEKAAASAARPVELRIWNYYTGGQQEALLELSRDFNEGKGKELGIRLSVSSAGSLADLENNVIAAAEKKAGAGELPDIVSTYTDTAFALDELGLLSDLSPYFTAEEKAEYVDSYIQEGQLHTKEELKIIPVAKATEVFMLNATDWKPFSEETGTGLEELSTLEGLVEVAEKYYRWTDEKTETPDDGKAFYGRDSMANYMVIGTRQLGHDIITRKEDGNAEIRFPRDVARKLWDHYYIPYVRGYFSSVGRFRSDDVKTGNVLSYVGSSAGTEFFPKQVILSDTEKYPIELLVLPCPGFSEGEGYAVQQGAGMAVIKRSEERTAAAAAFLKWMTEEEQNIRFCMASSYLPVKKKANSLQLMKEYSRNEAVMQTLEVALGTVNGKKMYTTEAVREGRGIRERLEFFMSDRAIQDRAAVVTAMASGQSREEALLFYESEENFSDWYQELTEALNKLAGK